MLKSILFKKALLLLSISVSLFGCGGSGGGESNPDYQLTGQSYQVIDGKLVTKAIATNAWDPITKVNKYSPSNHFGMDGSISNPVLIDKLQADLTVTSIKTTPRSSGYPQSRGRAGLLLGLKNAEGHIAYVTIYIEQRHGESLTTRAWRNYFNGSDWAGEIELSTLANLPIDTNTTYKFKLELFETPEKFIRLSINDKTIDIPNSKLAPSSGMKIVDAVFFSRVKYPNEGDYIIGTIDNVVTSLYGQSGEISENFNSYQNGDIPSASSVFNDVHLGSLFQGSYYVLATTNKDGCNGGSGSFNVSNNGDISGSLLSSFTKTFDIVGDSSTSGAISNGAFASNGAIAVNYDGSFGASTGSGSWTAQDGSGCTGVWNATKAASEAGISPAYLTANPWYIVNSQGGCLAKFTYKNTGTVIGDFIDPSSGNPISFPLGYTLTANNITISHPGLPSSIFGTYFYSTKDLFIHKTTDDSGNGYAETAFKNYQDAINYATANGNPNCATTIPQ